ncbi:SDR family oxidoreductase [Xanthomonas campestris pv. raphani]|nr:SDR family oxidoreductase [Xanthomonas campestris pv. raphani]WDJ26843.1 SDR family oxidoreductase [Xanthomonas campestris pv. raphani]
MRWCWDAVEILSVYLARELGPRGITANTVAPGAIATGFPGGAVRDTPAHTNAVVIAHHVGARLRATKLSR